MLLRMPFIVPSSSSIERVLFDTKDGEGERNLP